MPPLEKEIHRLKSVLGRNVLVQKCLRTRINLRNTIFGPDCSVQNAHPG